VQPPSFAEVAAYYELPARPGQRRRSPAYLPPWRVAALRRQVERARSAGTPRLAWIDSTFPWRRSGFRYQEALAFHEALPETVFFSDWVLTDDFPATVRRLADFPRIAAREGITDAYGVFQAFLAGVVGLQSPPDLKGHPMVGTDLSRLLRRTGIRLHGTLYPGGGLVPTPEGLHATRRLAVHLNTAFSYVPEVLESVPGVQPIPQALTDVEFYATTDDRWAATNPLRCLFVADAPPRKGFDAVIAAFKDLSSTDFHLDVVGPHRHRQGEFAPGLATFHGWLEPEALRRLHRRAHVLLSPVQAAPDGVVDGFPTQAAADAMSSGCLLLGSNPALDFRVLTPGLDYVPCEAHQQAIRQSLVALTLDPTSMRRIAERGTAQVRGRMDICLSTHVKLVAMGFGPRVCDDRSTNQSLE
jgi:glycosyltransferase involved in cell wall biosynthesis